MRTRICFTAPRVRASAITGVAVAIAFVLSTPSSVAGPPTDALYPPRFERANAGARVEAPDYVARVHAAFTPANRRYARVRQGLALFEPLWGLVFVSLLLFTRASARIRDVARRMFRRRYGRVFAYLVVAGLVAFAFHLPLAAFRDYWWEHRFGLSNQSALVWFTDELKALALELAFLGGTGLVALALWGIEAAGRRWWLWLACGVLPVATAAVLLQPLVFEPAFNRFEPLGDAGLDRRILALAARAGIPARHVFQVDRSRQTRTINAYVSGFGPSQRIVLWDTTLRSLSADEILFVMGHEMGHYKLHHLWKGILLAWMLSFGLLFVGARLMSRALRRFGAAWGIGSLGDEAALPLIAGVLGALLVAAAPALNGWSRRVEHEADAFGLEATRLNDAAARAFEKLGEMNRSDPDPPPALRLLLYTHPPLLDRVRFALTYRPWEQGLPGRYFKGAPPGDEGRNSRSRDARPRRAPRAPGSRTGDAASNCRRSAVSHHSRTTSRRVRRSDGVTSRTKYTPGLARWPAPSARSHWRK